MKSNDLGAIDLATVEAEFEAWWESDGQYCRAGGGSYEKTFAFRAYEAAIASANTHFSTVPTIVDLANADADGYRNGRASVVVELPKRPKRIAGLTPLVEAHIDGFAACLDECRAAIEAAGGTVRE